MAGRNYTTASVPISSKALNGGLNSAGGALSLQDNESSDLQNIDFDKFGSIMKRNGYTALNTTSLNAGADSNGLVWYEYESAGTTIRKAVNVCGNKIYKMDDLDGTWDNITSASAITITTGNHCDFETWQRRLFATNGNDLPFNWDATNCSGITLSEVPATMTKAKFVKQFNNYLFYGNITLATGANSSRIYWSDFKNAKSWTAISFIDIAQNDGQEITGMKVLSDRLVVFKDRSIYNVYFTGDVDVPFVMPGGGKSNSTVGCIAPFSIQEVDNGLVFLSYDGFYYYDGMNSYKISDKVTDTLDGMSKTMLTKVVSLVQKNKNRCLWGMTASGSSEHNRVIVWDYSANIWSVYTGMSPSSMATFFVSGTDEQPYWADYGGYTYRGDVGSTDYPLNVATAIDAYYWTNWKTYDDLVDQKGVAHIAIYHQVASTTLTFAYAYDFDSGAQYTQSIDLSTSSDKYGTGVYGTAKYARSGGNVIRRDMPLGRGRVIRFKFANNIIGKTFQIDGFGTEAHLETNA